MHTHIYKLPKTQEKDKILKASQSGGKINSLHTEEKYKKYENKSFV